MEPSILLKYAAGGALLASVYYLVLVDKMTPQEYVMLVTGALGALGITAFTKDPPK